MCVAGTIPGVYTRFTGAAERTELTAAVTALARTVVLQGPDTALYVATPLEGDASQWLHHALQWCCAGQLLLESEWSTRTSTTRVVRPGSQLASADVGWLMECLTCSARAGRL